VKGTTHQKLARRKRRIEKRLAQHVGLAVEEEAADLDGLVDDVPVGEDFALVGDEDAGAGDGLGDFLALLKAFGDALDEDDSGEVRGGEGMERGGGVGGAKGRRRASRGRYRRGAFGGRRIG